MKHKNQNYRKLKKILILNPLVIYVEKYKKNTKRKYKKNT